MSKIKVRWGALIMLFVSLVSERTDIFLLWGLCALLHELGHLFAARVRKIEVEEIRLDFLGARICVKEGAGSYFDEVLIAAAGPSVNLIIVIAAALYLQGAGISPEALADSITAFFEGDRSSVGAVCFFAICSVLQGGTNLLPVKTFDGGRVIYCMTASLFGQGMAEALIGASTAACVFCLWTVALYLMLKTGAGLGIYVFCACLFLSTLSDSELIKK